MDDYSDKDQAAEKPAAKQTEKPATKPVEKVVKGPTFYRNPEGGPLTTTKPPDDDE